VTNLLVELPETIFVRLDDIVEEGKDSGISSVHVLPFRGNYRHMHDALLRLAAADYTVSVLKRGKRSVVLEIDQ
jgi:hypothetical protein